MKLLKKMILSGFTLAIIGGFGLQAGDATDDPFAHFINEDGTVKSDVFEQMPKAVIPVEVPMDEEESYDPFAELQSNVDLGGDSSAGGDDWVENILGDDWSKSVLSRNETGDLFLDDVKDFDENALDSSSAPTPAFVPKPVGEASTEPSDLVEANNVVAVEAALRAAGSNYSDIIGWGLGDKQARLSIGESSRDSSPVGTPSTLSRTPSFSDLSSHSDSDTDGAAIDDDDLLGGTPPSSPKSLPKASPNAASVDLSGVNLVDLEAELLKNGPVEHMTNIYATTILENNLAAKVKLNKEWDIEL